MIHEPTIQPTPSSSNTGDDEPTIPRIPAQRVQTSSAECTLQVRSNSAFTVSIDQQGIVNLDIPGRDALILGPEEAFDLLDFLYAHRNLLASRSADIAERQADSQKEFE
jgi:hypothetical protein